MARTYRRKAFHFLRRPKTTNTRRGEYTTMLDMLGEGLLARNRHRARANLRNINGNIPSAWSDLFVAALSEKWSMPKKWKRWGCCFFHNERGSGRDI